MKRALRLWTISALLGLAPLRAEVAVLIAGATDADVAARATALFTVNFLHNLPPVR